MTTTDAVPAAELPSAPPPAEPLAPVAANERVETIDILRGLALFGILAANIRGFAGPALVYFDASRYWTSFHDRLGQAFVDTFIQGKFITLFAFLFGVGFAIQLERSRTREGKFGWTYARRLFILLGFGLIHGLLIWWGDILLVYALTGFLLLLFRKRRDKTLMAWGIASFMFMLVLMAAVFTAAQFGHAPKPPKPPDAQALQKSTETFAHGTWTQIEAERASDAVKHNWAFTPIFFTHVLALFLAGTLAWRRGLFFPSPESLGKYRRAMWIGFAIGIPGNLAITVLRWKYTIPQMPVSPLPIAVALLSAFCVPALSIGYLCLVILLCQSEAWRARLRRFGAVGRTALTNYLLQSIVGTLLFYSYGLGLFGRFGPAILLVFTVVIYAIQVVISQWWLARYRYGPAEWLWRSATYGRRLPLARDPVLPVPDVATT
jgi:uncharacterized protein